MKKQWQSYKSLELIPDFVPEPQANKSEFMTQSEQFWRSVVGKHIDRFSSNQQAEHLEQCWTLNERDHHKTQGRFWQKVWFLLNQPISDLFPSASSEPEIRQVLEGGRAWWYAYDPLTGQQVYLESEDEVFIWLEERLHFH